MKKFASVVVLGLLVIGITTADDTKKPDEPAPKAKLPTHWSKLGLSDKQKQDYYDTYAKHHKVIAELEAKLKDEKAALVKDEQAILTTEQKAALKAILLKEPPPATEKPPVKDKP